jgi:hypothetical protein
MFRIFNPKFKRFVSSESYAETKSERNIFNDFKKEMKSKNNNNIIILPSIIIADSSDSDSDSDSEQEIIKDDKPVITADYYYK